MCHLLRLEFLLLSGVGIDGQFGPCRPGRSFLLEHGNPAANLLEGSAGGPRGQLWHSDLLFGTRAESMGSAAQALSHGIAQRTPGLRRALASVHRTLTRN